MSKRPHDGKTQPRGNFIIGWIDRGHPPKQPPNPDYPDGCDINLTASTDFPTCVASLPYPTGHKNVGTWDIKCRTCLLRVHVTAASRPDDPRMVEVACKEVNPFV